MLKPGGHLHGIIGNSWIMNTVRGSTDIRPDDNLLLKNLKDITKFTKQKDAVKFSNVQVSNTYFIHIKKQPFGIYTDTNNRILNTKYYIIQPDITIGQDIEDGEKSLKDLLPEKTEKINYVEAPPEKPKEEPKKDLNNEILNIVITNKSIIGKVLAKINFKGRIENNVINLASQINRNFKTDKEKQDFIDAVRTQ